MKNKELIISFLRSHPNSSSTEIFENANLNIAYATVRRELAKLVDSGGVIIKGKGKASRYSISTIASLLETVDIEQYFQIEIDQRQINNSYNFELIATLENISILNREDLNKLSLLQNLFLKNISTISKTEYRKEMERLGIDLSWKSSQIEGNTYSLLETERLLKEKETASGKTRDEATMLLNHKDALDFIVGNENYLSELSTAKIESIHSILIKELGVEKNLRNRRVGITGTNYTPLDNKFQIRDEMENSCRLINSKENIFEKALLVLLMLSYIQPFADGNKRTARIVCNAILIANGYCPLSFRSVDSIEYKKAMLLFYEQANVSAFKKIFIDQYEFAVKTYF